MDDRIPCAICGTTILPITAKSNAGLCGQCIRDPERARKRAARKKTLLGWGDPSREAIRSRLFEACHTAAVEAVRRFSSETIYGFFLYLDPCWESISGVRVFTEAWARTETSTGLWTPLYTEETAAYIVGVEATEAVSEFASRRSPQVTCSRIASMRWGPCRTVQFSLRELCLEPAQGMNRLKRRWRSANSPIGSTSPIGMRRLSLVIKANWSSGDANSMKWFKELEQCRTRALCAPSLCSKPFQKRYSRRP
jgi:hypothetical protein